MHRINFQTEEEIVKILPHRNPTVEETKHNSMISFALPAFFSFIYQWVVYFPVSNENVPYTFLRRPVQNILQLFIYWLG